VDTVLAIDQGTTSTRAWRVETDGAMRFVGSHQHRQIHPHPGWVEHDPEELLEAIRGLIAKAGKVARIGIANQGETVVAWDATTRRPLGNAIVWQDTRTLPHLGRMRADGLEGMVRSRAGLPLDPYFSAAKLRWLYDHLPDARELHAAGRLRLGTSDAFFLDALAGCHASDVSTASRTSLMNLADLSWDDALCAAFGVPRDCLPEIIDSAGELAPMPGGSLLGASIVDQQAALFGHGCGSLGDLKITFGTGAFALALAGSTPPDPGTTGLLPTCAWRIGGRIAYALDGGITTAGSAVEWLRSIGLLEGFEALESYAGPSAAEEGLMFVPAQAGLGCPHWDRSARALWIGMAPDTTRAALCRAVLEGIALRAAELVAAFETCAGAVRRISVDGGLTRSGYFTGFFAASLGRPIFVCDQAEITTRGLAALCSGRTEPSLPPGRCLVPNRILPIGIHDRFRDALARAGGWANYTDR
jgi:glycerol kinase